MRYGFLIAAIVGCATLVRGNVLLHESFSNDPIQAGRAAVTTGDAARFSFGAHGLTAAYDTSLPTAKLAWPLAQTLDASHDFSVRVEAALLANGFHASPNHFAQIAFGLVNSATTGNDRAGGDGGDAFDLVSVDYFPNVSPLFGGPTLGPTVIGTDRGGSYFSSIQFPFGMETALDNEGPLPLDIPLEFELTYAAESGLLTLTVASAQSLLPINANQPEIEAGGLDGDPTTIQLLLEPGTEFSLDQFAILLWEDTFLAAGASPSVQANLSFSEITVSTPDDGVPGDTDADGDVDLEDLNNVRNHFGAAGSAGDAHPRDGVVDLNDLNLVRNHFGTVPTSVPEPATMVLMLIAGCGATHLIRRKNVTR